MLIQSMDPNIDADLLMKKMGLVPTPLPAVDTVADKGLEGGSGGPTAEREAVPEVAREEAEQPLLTPEEVVANLAAGDTDVAEKPMEMGVENPTERVNEATNGTAEEREVPTAAKEEGRKRKTPRDEAARARAATMHIYQMRPARAEASRKKSAEEQQKRAPEKNAEGGDERQERSVVGLLRRRRRLILDEESDEIEKEVAFTLIEALPSSGQPTPPVEIEDPKRENRERKRKGKAVVGPVKKKPRQTSSTLVIHEGRQGAEEDDDDEEEALRRERRSKRRERLSRG